MMALLAGTAVRDISPRKPSFLAGYPHVPRLSTGVHDPLLATALVLRDDPVVPRVDPEYLALLKSAIVEAAGEASRSLRPAALAWTSSQVGGLSGNRRSPDGPSDPHAGILAVRDAARDRLMALSITVRRKSVHLGPPLGIMAGLSLGRPARRG